MLTLKLILVFFKLGFFAFGGGWAVVRLLQEELVTKGGFLNQQEFVDLISIAQITPGPVAVNMATYVGARLGGAIVGVLSTLALVAAPLTIISIVGMLAKRIATTVSLRDIDRVLNLGTVVLISGAVISIVESVRIGLPTILLGILAFVVIRKLRASPLLVLIGGGIVGMLFFSK